MVYTLQDLVQASPLCPVEVYNAEDGSASISTRKEEDGLFDGYGDNS